MAWDSVSPAVTITDMSKVMTEYSLPRLSKGAVAEEDGTLDVSDRILEVNGKTMVRHFSRGCCGNIERNGERREDKS